MDNYDSCITLLSLELIERGREGERRRWVQEEEEET